MILKALADQDHEGEYHSSRIESVLSMPSITYYLTFMATRIGVKRTAGDLWMVKGECTVVPTTEQVGI